MPPRGDAVRDTTLVLLLSGLGRGGGGGSGMGPNMGRWKELSELGVVSVEKGFIGSGGGGP